MPKVYVHVVHKGDPAGWETIFGLGKVSEDVSQHIHAALQNSLSDWLLAGDIKLTTEVTSITGTEVRHTMLVCKDDRLVYEASAAVRSIRATWASHPPEPT